jgi:hypothetical protein
MPIKAIGPKKQKRGSPDKDFSLASKYGRFLWVWSILLKRPRMMLRRKKMRGTSKIIGLCLALLFVYGLEEQTGFSQPSQKLDKDPLVEVGRIDFRLKEVQATPSPIQMLEIQIEIINPNPKETVPPNSIKVIAIPKEIRFSSESAAGPFTLPPEEVALNSPLPPKAVRIMIMGFSLPPEKPESISFEVQVNPPGGEKRTATYHF